MDDWRLIEESHGRPGADNMAVDQTLLEGVQAGGRPTLRLYRWAPPCLSLGRNEAVRGRYDLAAAARRGVEVVRRPTGGLAVYHDRELTYAVAVPVGALGPPRESYRAISRALVGALRRLGVNAELAAEVSGRPALRGAGGSERVGPCFRAAAPGEVVAAGRKLVGSAQRRERRALLQHGSLLLDGDQSIVVELMTPSVRPGGRPASTPLAPVVPPPATLFALLGRVPPWSALVDAVRAGFEETLGIRLAPDGLSRTERARARALAARYRSAAWTRRR